jgi:hypothetical protein
MKREVIASLATHADVDPGTTDEGRPLVVVTFFRKAADGERVEIASVALDPDGAGRLADALLDSAQRVRSGELGGSEA